MRAWLPIAAQPAIIRRATLTSLVVGTILTLVNHGPALVGDRLTSETLGPIMLTYATPYVVATISSAAAIGSHVVPLRPEGKT